MKLSRKTSKRSRALSWALRLVFVSAPTLLVAEELLNPVGVLTNHGSSIESFERKGEHLYIWDGHAFKVLNATEWPDFQLLGEVDIGSPVTYSSQDRIQTIGSKAYLYDAEPVWLLNPDDTTTAPPLYRQVIDLEDPTAPSIEEPVQFESMHFATSAHVAVASFPRDGTTILEITEAGEVVERSTLDEPGVPTILDDRVYLCNEGSVSVVDLTDLHQPEVTRLRADVLEDDSFSEPVFWDHYMADGDIWGSLLRIWDVEDPLEVRLLIAMELEATSVRAVAVEFPILYVESGVSGTPTAVVGIDVSNPAAPLVVGRSELNGSIEDVRVVNSRATILMGGRLNFYEISLSRPSESAYSAWQERYFPGQTELYLVGQDADPDRDGVCNWMEFALGRRPSDRESPPLALVFRDNEAFVSFERRADVARWFDYVIETSPSMAPGDWESVTEERKVGELFGAEFYEADVPEGHRYARLRVVGK